MSIILMRFYRVNPSKATQFRIWATKILKEYIIKGFDMDDDRLENGRYFGKDYFKELLERVRSIRTSERRIFNRLQIYLQSVVLIMIKIHKRPKVFMQPYRTSFTLPSQVKQPLKSYMKMQILKSQIWG